MGVHHPRAISRTIDVDVDPIEQNAKLEKLRKMTKRVEKLGGIGPQLNSPEWKNKMQLRMKAKQFSEFNDKVNRMMYHEQIKEPNSPKGSDS